MSDPVSFADANRAYTAAYTGFLRATTATTEANPHPRGSEAWREHQWDALAEARATLDAAAKVKWEAQRREYPS